MPRRRKKPGTRKVECRLFIICEGMKDKSESAYFKSLIKSYRFPGNKVEVKVIDTKKNTGKELVVEAKKSREFPHDIVWIVYDKDGYTKHPDTFEAARHACVKIAFSSISFEYWILLHYEYTSREFTKSDEIIKYLRDRNFIIYTKGSQLTYLETKSKIHIAKRHAKQIQRHQEVSNPTGTQIYQFNPYTNINELIDEIEKLLYYK